ncbi:MAG: hypothetical protein Q7T55_25650 [Solirubrobacteraceae bacterium]|nr:hypothetical protein [Solirubrobacteraceae bacterium]
MGHGADGNSGSGPERTPDGRYIIVDGRRWRASDPGLPEERRQELVDQLMAARRDVGTAKRAGDATAERAARDRVHEAKVALGERGTPWWEEPRS